MVICASLVYSGSEINPYELATGFFFVVFFKIHSGISVNKNLLSVSLSKNDTLLLIWL